MRAQWVGDFSLFKANKPESEWESKPSLFGSTQNGNGNGPTSSLLSHTVPCGLKILLNTS